MSQRLPCLLVGLLLTACQGRCPPPRAPAPLPPPPRVQDDTSVAAVADALDQELMQQVVATRTLAENAYVRGYLTDRSHPHKVLTVLRDVVTRSGADAASLLDAAGVVAVSTDPDAMGYDFSHWAFFQAVREGEVLVFPAVGYASERRGLFVVVPENGEAGQLRGAAVLRSGVGRLERLLGGLCEPAALVYRDRYVLATNREEWGLHGLRRLDERGRIVDLDERRLLDMLDTVVPPIGDTVEVGGRTYAVRRIPTFLRDWRFLVLGP